MIDKVWGYLSEAGIERGAADANVQYNLCYASLRGGARSGLDARVKNVLISRGLLPQQIAGKEEE